MENEQAKFSGWAIVEVMGHQRYAGYVTTEAYGGAVLFRVDVPELAERERETKRPGYMGAQYLPAGAVVKESAVQGYTKLVGAGSIYCITPCTEEAALEAVEGMQSRPLMLVRLPDTVALPAPEEGEEAEEAEEDDDDDNDNEVPY